MSVNTHLKNAALMGGGVAPVRTNSPSQYANRQKQYFDSETRHFNFLKARYSSDFMDAEVQGLDEGDPTAWGTYRIRFADVVRASSAIQRNFDDYKQYLFESKKIDYVRPGTKILTMGNTWLVTNPNNISGASGTGICRRCNTVWNYYDADGNLCSEPMVVENDRANANDSDAQQSLLITKGYFNVICQYNEATRQIDTNTRMILGTAAYRVTGYSDFDMEFTGDYDSVRLLYFTVRYEEPNETIDDMESHVASGKAWEEEHDPDTVQPETVQTGVAFDTPLPVTISYGETATVSAAFYQSGTKTADLVTFSFGGADAYAYSTSVDGNSATVTGYGYSETPLTITASYGGYSASATVLMEGI